MLVLEHWLCPFLTFVLNPVLACTVDVPSFSSFLTGGTTCSGCRVTNYLYGIVLIDGQAKYNSSTLNNQGTGAGQSTGSGGAGAVAPTSVGRARTRPYGAPHGAAQLDSLKLYQDKPPHVVTCGGSSICHEHK